MTSRSRRALVIGVPAILLAGRTRDALAGPKTTTAKPRTVSPTTAPAATSSATAPKPTATASTPTTITKIDKATMRRAKVHQLRPAHVAGASSDAGVSASERLVVKLAPHLHKIDVTPKLDVAKFGETLHAKFEGRVQGYAMQLRRKGVVTYNLQWEWARRPVDGSTGWTMSTQMHVASVSKLLTAMATVHALQNKPDGVDTKIAPYLPSYWNLGPKIDQLTFRHLLTHMSGFHYEGSDSDYGFMKSKVAVGVAAKLGQYQYHNMNFGLCRLLLPIMTGTMPKYADYGPLNDKIWDVLTTEQFRKYCNAHVFNPAGVGNAGFVPKGASAFAYRHPVGASMAWNSGDLSTVAGGAGFRLTIDQLLDVMGTFRRSGKIVTPAKAQKSLDDFLGIDQRIDTPAGKLYNKNGLWRDDGRTEQSVAYFLPEDMELVCFVNSPITASSVTPSGSLRGVIAETYVECLK